jgi:hypothetical protein
MPQSQQANGGRPTPYKVQPLGSAKYWYNEKVTVTKYLPGTAPNKEPCLYSIFSGCGSIRPDCMYFGSDARKAVAA